MKQDNKTKEKEMTRGQKDYQKYKEYHKKRQQSEEYKTMKKNYKQDKEYQKEYYQKNKKRLDKKFKNVPEIIKKSRAYAKNHFKRLNNCYFCESELNLEFHHLRYRVPCKREDVITLCKSCHNDIHFIIDCHKKEQANLFDEFLQDLNKIKYRVDLDERISNMREELKKKFIKG